MSARTWLALAALAFAPSALACSCGNTTPERVFDESTQVIFAKIVGVEDVGAKSVPTGAFEPGHNYGIRATFELLDTFKGDAQALDALGTGYGGGDCGVSLVPGRSYLLNVRAHGTVGSCGIVREVDPTNCRWPALRDALLARGRDGATTLDLPPADDLKLSGECAAP